MGFRKTFNNSERTAISALGELVRQGLYEPSILNFRYMILGEPECKNEGGRDWITRFIAFWLDERSRITVEVRTPTGQGYSSRHRDDHVIWMSKRAEFHEDGDLIKEFIRESYPSHVYWARVR